METITTHKEINKENKKQRAIFNCTLEILLYRPTDFRAKTQ